ncbi:fasciclin domain-containing protein [Olleya sp. HaHaR_3_96]|uniref:fasciclin domain-containing protein n=1 Tax=Olleya sp. HaHaR_3_96 TaxID=2745560 RepID=UPI001C4F4204|nr:fasciclin domain-containing protein [Olleya sp. HaHaR_3_96]
MNISKLIKSTVFTVALFSTINGFSQDNMKKEKMKTEKTVMVGGAEMYPSKTIVANAVNSKEHTTLVAAVKAAGLVETLSSDGPFTVFAPTNAAFAKLPEGTVETLLQPENLTTLQTVLKNHVVAGTLNAKTLLKLIKKGDGKAELTTVSGGMLTAWVKDKEVYITDQNGNSAKVTIADVNQSNGVIHVIDTVVLPKA